MGALVKNENQYVHKNKGVCSSAIEFEVENGTLKNVQFIGGCNGNTQGISKLVEGMKVEDVITRLEGVKCGTRPTSCPDQLAKALKAYQEDAANTAAM
ncbi:MAG: TIGR03905 family TSCPD domain-containing protein [Eubacteriales bacterium]|nr:TIGR03905 family TSCPD domain-containing protein [Eubacteriales bacterium]